MPGKQVKDWRHYHKLRMSGKSKQEAAMIANYHAKRKRLASKRKAQNG